MADPVCHNARHIFRCMTVLGKCGQRRDQEKNRNKKVWQSAESDLLIRKKTRTEKFDEVRKVISRSGKKQELKSLTRCGEWSLDQEKNKDWKVWRSAESDLSIRKKTRIEKFDEVYTADSTNFSQNRILSDTAEKEHEASNAKVIK